MEPEVIFCDNHLFVLNKPAGWLTQPIPDSNVSLEAWGKNWLKKTFNKPGNVFLHATHRIDKPISGLVLFARTSKALSRLQESLRNHQFQKTYFGIVGGTLLENRGEYIDWLVHDDHRARIVSPENEKGKKCILKYRVLKKQNPYTLVEISLQTGRYHQIRVQFSSRGFPLVADQKYGSSLLLTHPSAIALHHGRLQVPHPISQKIMEWEIGCPSFWPLSWPL